MYLCNTTIDKNYNNQKNTWYHNIKEQNIDNNVTYIFILSVLLQFIVINKTLEHGTVINIF